MKIDSLKPHESSDLSPKKDSPEQIKKLAQEFESVFYEIVLRSMRQTVAKSGFIDGGNGEDIYRSMMDSEYAKEMSKQEMSQLAQALEKELLKNHGLDKQAKNAAQKIYQQSQKLESQTLITPGKQEKI